MTGREGCRRGRKGLGVLGGFFEDGGDGSFGEVLGTEPEPREGTDDVSDERGDGSPRWPCQIRV